MRLILSIFFIFTLFVNGIPGDQLTISPREEALTEDRFGVTLYDPFRWMENMDDPELIPWIEKQNDKTKKYVDGDLFEQIQTELTDIIKRSPEILKTDEMRQLRIEELHDNYLRRIRPTPLNDDLAPQIITSSRGRYKIEINSDSSSDLGRLEIIDTTTDHRLRDILMVKFPQIYWDKDEKSFLYLTYRDGRLGHIYPAIFRHTLGEKQPNDKLLYQANEIGAWVDLYKFDNEFFISTGKEDRSRFGEFNDKTGEITPIIDEVLGDMRPITYKKNLMYFLSYCNAPLGKIVAVDTRNGSIKMVMPEQKFVIDSVMNIKESFFITLIENTSSKLLRFDNETGMIKQIQLPMDGRVQMANKNETLICAMKSYSKPTSLWKYNKEKNELKLIEEADPLPFPLESFRTYYQAHNGNQVPIWIVKKTDVPLSPETPVFLYGYGGFSINILPSFNPVYLPWYKRGGVCAFVTLPGGFEYGEEWHKAGKLHNKKNVFNDFASAAKHLIDKGYTSSEKLVCNGASNGGLLVGAVINQYPHLFRAAVPEVGVMDMERYQLFTAGKWWVSEYGDRNDTDSFNNLLSVSPYHNIGQHAYPSVLVLTADFDDRVVPSHSFKYTARLQSQHRGDNPVLLHTKLWGAHSRLSGTPNEQIKYHATKWTFILTELDVE